MKAVPSKPDPLKPGLLNRGGGRVGDVDQRDADRLLNEIRQLMHGIGTQHDEIRAAALQPLRRVGHNLPGLIPLAAVLKLLNLGEIDRVH